MSAQEFNYLLAFVLIAIVSSGLIGALMLAKALKNFKKIDIPPGSGFADTLLLTPLYIVIAIDLLDLGLDFLSAPISWTVLDRLGLKALRQVAVVEAVIPGTQLFPTMTLCWLGVRLYSRIN